MAPAEDGLGAHGAQGDSHGVGVGGYISTGRDGALKVLCHGVPHACPQVFHRSVGDDLGIDEDVGRRHLGEGILPQAAIGMVEDSQAGAGRASGCDGGEGKEGTVGLMGQHFTGIDGFAAAHRKDHIRVRHLGQEHLDIFHRGLSPVPIGTGDLNVRTLHGFADLLFRCGQGVFTADDGGFLSKGSAHVGNIGIGVLPDGISSKQCFLHS